jgi:DNA-binding response OmpR family regulator
MAKEILIIENEGFIAGLLSKSLLRKGYDISILEHDDALKRARKHKASLVLLEAPASGAEASKTCRFLRDATAAPIIALTESPAHLEEIDGVECLTKPVVFRELLKTVENTLKRQRGPRKRRVHVLRCGNLALHLKNHSLIKGDDRYRLTPKEFSLLKLFMRNPGKVLTHKAIMKHVWNTDYLDDLRTLYVHVSWIRKKIEDAPEKPSYLRTVRGVGYRFETKP